VTAARGSAFGAPYSKHSRWFQERFGGGRKRQRRIGTVALARRLLIDLWRFVESGVVIDAKVVIKFQVMKSVGPSRVVPAGSAGIQGQGWQKQWGFESSGRTITPL